MRPGAGLLTPCSFLVKSAHFAARAIGTAFLMAYADNEARHHAGTRSRLVGL